MVSIALSAMGIVAIAGDSAMLTIGPVRSVARLDAQGRVREVEVASQRLRAVRVDGAALAGLRVGAPDYSAPAGAPYTAQEVTIPATGGHTLAATLTLPSAREGRVPVVVTITGSGPQDRDEYIPLAPNFRPFRQLADTLGRRGIAVLRFDDRGTGASTGDHAKATSADFADDVRSAVRWLRSRPEIDPDRVLLAGHSEGGMIAPMVAANDPQLAGIVLMAGPGEKGETILRFQLRNLTMQDTSLRGTRRDSALKAIDGTIAGLKKDNVWMRFFLEHDPLPIARRVKVPVYIAQGATDQQVLAPQAQVLADVLRNSGNQNVTVKVFPNLNHLFLYDPDGSPLNYTKLPSGKIGPEVMGPIADWVVLQAKAVKPRVVP
jgi:dipeptidyl aminopeptidase/acylaminoacyl peptidase